MGEFKKISWCKHERGNLLKACGVDIEHGKPIEMENTCEFTQS